MTSIVDFDNIKPFDWGEFCSESYFKKKVKCKSCNGTGKIKKDVYFKDKPNLLKLLKQENIETESWPLNCSLCYGKGNVDAWDYGKCMGPNRHFLMAGTTFLGDVGASIYVHETDKIIDGLVIDIVGYTFGNIEEQLY